MPYSSFESVSPATYSENTQENIWQEIIAVHNTFSIYYVFVNKNKLQVLALENIGKLYPPHFSYFLFLFFFIQLSTLPSNNIVAREDQGNL